MPTLQIDGLSAPLRVVRYAGSEAMSDTFEFEFHVITDDAQVAFADVIGKPADFQFSEDIEAPRHVRGIIRRFEYLHHHSRHTTYRAVLVPRAFRLTLRRNNRIFQGKTAPQIIEAVIGEAEIEEHTLALSGSYAAREYCVQYRESDWDFINRLMEEEGIFYYFEHGADATKLVIADSPSVHNPIDGNPSLKLRRDTGALAIDEHINSLHYGEELRPGKITMRDYNFKTPKLSLEASSAAEAEADLELYDYPGNYGEPGLGGQLTKRRLEAIQAPRKSGEGQSNCARLTPGCKFTLDDSVGEVLREDLAQEYLITRVEHEGHDPRMLGEGDAPGYRNRFSVVPATVPFRPVPRTPRPRIYGVQTAVVTGAAGEEIHTDEHGRIKVQFFWDREGKQDEHSSCWIRVSQTWAGASWGAVFLPRVGHEVVVDFLEGNPDRPLVVGSVYHGTNVPPYALPADKTKSAIKSNSSAGGNGSNELRFEDKKGSEEIYLHGEKNWTIEIENDKTETVGRDQSLEVVRNRTKHVGKNQRESVGGSKDIVVSGHHTEKVGESMATAVGTSLTLKVGTDHTDSVGQNRTITVGSDHEESIGGSMSLTVTKNRSEKVGGASSETVAKSKKTSVEDDYTLTVSKDMNLTVSQSLKQDIKEDKTLIVGKKITVECGEAKITIDKSGDIVVEGKNISVKGDGTIKVEAKKLDVKSDGAVNLEASGKVVIKGSNVGVN
ncbi:type VI secretion system Vgr family protein [Sorangium sp. So ce861]|uniref:type VI secretion system Vgr family protein n=1 Tax=Sorangium sp. So ce861 TaxID=3133323 RepID=UPI003F601283